MRLLMSLLLLFLCTASPVSAGPFEDGDAAYSRSDYATAMRLLRPLADQGNGRAQILVGMMHELGQGVAKNGAAAAEWYRKAADRAGPPPRATSAPSTRKVWVCRRIMCRPTSGGPSRPHAFPRASDAILPSRAAARLSRR